MCRCVLLVSLLLLLVCSCLVSCAVVSEYTANGTSCNANETTLVRKYFVPQDGQCVELTSDGDLERHAETETVQVVCEQGGYYSPWTYSRYEVEGSKPTCNDTQHYVYHGTANGTGEPDIRRVLVRVGNSSVPACVRVDCRQSADLKAVTITIAVLVSVILLSMATCVTLIRKAHQTTEDQQDQHKFYQYMVEEQ